MKNLLKIGKLILLTPFYVVVGFMWLVIMPFMVVGFSYALFKYVANLLKTFF